MATTNAKQKKTHYWIQFLVQAIIIFSLIVLFMYNTNRLRFHGGKIQFENKNPQVETFAKAIEIFSDIHTVSFGGGILCNYDNGGENYNVYLETINHGIIKLRRSVDKNEMNVIITAAKAVNIKVKQNYTSRLWFQALILGLIFFAIIWFIATFIASLILLATRNKNQNRPTNYPPPLERR